MNESWGDILSRGGEKTETVRAIHVAIIVGIRGSQAADQREMCAKRSARKVVSGSLRWISRSGPAADNSAVALNRPDFANVFNLGASTILPQPWSFFVRARIPPWIRQLAFWAGGVADQSKY
jgi:hypothetical protein